MPLALAGPPSVDPIEEPCSPAERDFRYAPSSFEGMFCRAAVLRSDCKEFRLFFDSLVNPAAPICGIFAALRQVAGNALAVQFKGLAFETFEKLN